MPTTKHAITRIARLAVMMRANRYPDYPSSISSRFISIRILSLIRFLYT